MTVRVEENVVEAGKNGISGTYGKFIINNEPGDAISAGGALPVETLQSIVDRLM